ncbi:MAG TPA: hypothetical protein VN929_03405 [Burkholderiales bacterium]|nr:hypothetical protein [Burkholderiales bacterium]
MTAGALVANPAAKTVARRSITRPDYVEAEIAKASLSPRATWLDLAATLRPETIVHLAKHLKEPADSKLLGALLERMLFPKALPVILANSKGLSDAERSDVVRGVYERILRAVRDGSPAVPDFLEAKFGLKVMQWTIDLVRKRVREKEGTVALEEHHLTAHEAAACEDAERELRERQFGERLTDVVARELSKLPRWVQQAFIQHYFDHIPIESDRLDAVTIATLHGKTGRAVRAWFAKIRATVKNETRRDDNGHQ